MTRNLMGSWIAIAAGLAACVPAYAASESAVNGRMWAMPSNAPVERLVTNLAAYAKEHPDDAYAAYLLGRVHGLAYTLKSKQVSYWPRSREGRPELPDIASDDFQFGAYGGFGVKIERPSQSELTHHLSEAVRHFGRAASLAGQRKLVEKPGSDDFALIELGYAYVLDVGLVASDQIDTAPQPPEADQAATPPSDDAAKAKADSERKELDGFIDKLGSESKDEREQAKKSLRASLAHAAPVLAERRNDSNDVRKAAIRELLREHWREVAIARYLRAFELTIEADAKSETQPMRGLGTLVSYEAGLAYIRLVKDRGVQPGGEATRLAKVEEGITKLKNLPPNGVITPIIFSFGASERVDELLESGSVASFDLRGTGEREWWPWLRPTTALLVWDPADERKITSGRDLFGNATWWMMFRNGYEAMNALDDDRDGVLRGYELRGLSAWFDEDGDGISTRTEVVSLASLGVRWLATSIEKWDGETPMNTRGMGLSDDRVLPTYDWMVRPVSESVEHPTLAGGAR